MKKIVTLVLFLITLNLKAQTHTTKGKEFWFTYMENIDLMYNGPPQFSVVISSEVNTTGQIEVPATGLAIPFSVTAMQPTEVYLPTGIFYPQGDEDIVNFGLKIVANDSVNVYSYHHRLYFSEASLVVPASELTSSCMITAQKDQSGNSPCEMVIEATQDSTQIEIIPSVITASFRPAHVPFTITLNEGQVFQLQSYYNLSGTTVAALDTTKKIAVFSGARQAMVHCTGADDHLYDMNYPGMFGQEFVLIDMLNQGGDRFIILSQQDSNMITINNGTPISIPAKGMYVDTLPQSASYIVSEKPVSVAQYNKSQACNTSQSGDPAMVIIPPISLLKNRAIFNCSDGIQGNATPNHFLLIVVNAATGLPLTLDGNPVTGFQPLSYNPQYLYKRMPISDGVHNLYSAGGFSAVAYGLGDYNAYAYHLGFDFKTNITSVNEIEGFNNGNFYPNPFSEVATLQLSNKKVVNDNILELYTIEGRLVFTKNFNGNSTTIEKENLKAGIYFYDVKNEGVVVAKGKVAVR